MQSLLFVPFLVMLLTRVTWSFVRMLGLFIQTAETLVLSLAFALCTAISCVASFSSPLTQLKNQALTQPTFETYEQLFRHVAHQSPTTAEHILNQQSKLSPAQRHALSLDTNEETAVQSEVVFWENALKLQPTDRDVLLNLYELYTNTNQPVKAQQALAKAKAIDPNYDYDAVMKSSTN